ncbi:MAG: DUF3127 domain-containing protein, partial [Bacteroidales bacterium]|nr:DUF3127 domain-containing protein [Bacteroidales bacterium]
MLYELHGTIYALGELIEGETRNGGTWQRREVVVEVQDGNYTNRVALTAFGDRVEDVEKFKEGDEVNIKFSISAHEYNDRYYNDINIVYIRRYRQEGWSDRMAGGDPRQARPYPGPKTYEDPAPAPAPKSRVDAVLDGEVSGANQDDDLPF